MFPPIKAAKGFAFGGCWACAELGFVLVFVFGAVEEVGWDAEVEVVAGFFFWIFSYNNDSLVGF